jgi:hypothetical protein
MNQRSVLEKVVGEAVKPPQVHLNRIDRKSFLCTQLGEHCNQLQLHKAIQEGTLSSGIPIEILDGLAAEIIKSESITLTPFIVVSDSVLVPFEWKLNRAVLRTAQKLAYLYGWGELMPDAFDEVSASKLVLLIGVMYGVKAANTAVTKLFGELSNKSDAQHPEAEPLEDSWYCQTALKIADRYEESQCCQFLGLAILLPFIVPKRYMSMAKRLQEFLSKMAHMLPDKLTGLENAVAISFNESEYEIVDILKDTI